MSCNNCFGGCVEITSDQCVKYTGLSISSLGIENGDSLAEVELAITTFLTNVLDATGILPDLDGITICEPIFSYLPQQGNITLVDVISAIINGVCDIQTQVTSIEADITTLNGDYDVDCLPVVTNSSDTHLVLQAVIDKLCALEDSFNQLDSDVPSLYVKLTDLDSLIATYLGSISSSSGYANRMVPYTVVEFWGDVTGKFDANGAGIGDWANIYLCNGQNGTPDKRGRVTVGITNVSGGGAYNSAVDPAISGNPTYTLFSTAGANTVTLTSPNQIPSHTHVSTPSLSITGHSHYSVGIGGTRTTLTSAVPISFDGTAGADYTLSGINMPATIGKTSIAQDTISLSIENSYVGGTTSHSNIQPSIACHYIMHIP